MSERLDPLDVSARVTNVILGEIDYDEDALPLVSPDGTRLAVRVGAPPSWKTKLAQNGSTLPPPCRIEIRQITPGLEVENSISGRYLLGRGLNETGFLIEEPLADGSRRIGLVSWENARITWLVDNEDVNAFADISNDGTLAYSRRATNAPAFELVVRRDGEEWVLPTEWERSWIDPVIAADNRTLFVFRRGDGTLELGWSRLLDETAFQIGMQLQLISDRVNDRTILNVLAAETGREASPEGTHPRLLFRHPALARLVAWSPNDDMIRQFPPGTISATMTGDDRAVTGNVDTVKLVELPLSVSESPVSITLLEEMAIPRRLGDDGKSILLIQPKDGRYVVSRMELVDVR